MIERIGYLTDYLETDGFPKFHGNGIAFDYEIELHRRKPESPCREAFRISAIKIKSKKGNGRQLTHIVEEVKPHR